MTNEIDLTITFENSYFDYDTKDNEYFIIKYLQEKLNLDPDEITDLDFRVYNDPANEECNKRIEICLELGNPPENYLNSENALPEEKKYKIKYYPKMSIQFEVDAKSAVEADFLAKKKIKDLDFQLSNESNQDVNYIHSLSGDYGIEVIENKKKKVFKWNI